MIADQTGSLANMKRHDYLPFGEEIGLIGGRTGLKGFMNDGTRQKFTGYERDWETGLDYAKARYDASAQGRFLSVDPLLASATKIHPQSFNRYAYCLNNPTNLTDPNGLMPYSGADQSWTDISDGFWGSSFNFGAPPTQNHIAEAMAQHDRWVDIDLSGGDYGDDDYPEAQIATSETLLTEVSVVASAVIFNFSGEQNQNSQEPTLTPDQEAMREILIGAQDAARTDPSLKPSGPTTYCNIATVATVKQVGAPLGPLVDNKGNALLANQQARNLATSGIYRVVTPKQAQALANKGQLVLAVQSSPGPHGHIATVRPEGVKGDSPVGRRGPLINNIGKHNRVARESASFSSKRSVIYYTWP
jgi:RHS repeat-associated protein